MNTNVSTKHLAQWLTLALLCLSTSILSAAQFTYEVIGETVEITSYPWDAVGEVVIPAEIDGRPVTSIGEWAFADCSSLTSITIPEGVTDIGGFAFERCRSLISITLPEGVAFIGWQAFRYCTSLTSITLPESLEYIDDEAFQYCRSLTSITLPEGLTQISYGLFRDCSRLESITIPMSVTYIPQVGLGIPEGEDPFAGCSNLARIHVNPGNLHYASDDGVLFDAAMTTILRYPPALRFRDGVLSRFYSIPEGVTEVGRYAFINCRYLRKIIVPGSVTDIGDFAFYGSGESGYLSVVFLGDAPLRVSYPFWHPHRSEYSVSVYRFDDATGFTSPWHEEPVFNMGPSSPITKWVLQQLLPSNTDVLSDINGDGVPLIMAYALNLDPAHIDFRAMPRVQRVGDQLLYTYYAGSEGIVYAVETSTDLQTWTTEGVITSDPDENCMCTASLTMSGSCAFLRLVVSR